MNPSVGDTIAGRYLLQKRLGEYGSHFAFLAFDTEVEVEVALWWLRSELVGSPAMCRAQAKRMRDVRGIKHPNLVKNSQFVETPIDGGIGLFLTMQLGDSAPMSDCLSSGISADATILHYAESLATALEAAHAAGVHHGWFTPSCVVDVASQIKLCGIGLFTENSPRCVEAFFGEEWRYLAPEVIAGEPSTAQSDWYGLAVLLLDLATGMHDANVADACVALEARDPRKLHALQGALSADPCLRPGSAQGFLDPLFDAFGGQRRPSRGESVEYIGVPAQVFPAPPVPKEPTTAVRKAAVESLWVSEVAKSAAIPLPKLSPGKRNVAKAIVLPTAPNVPPASEPVSHPPMFQSEAFTKAPSSIRWYIGAALVCTVATVVVLGGGSDEGEAPKDTTPASPAHSSATVTPKLACPAGTIRFDTDFCIDSYEFPGAGRQPQTGLSLGDATRACAKRNMRLCTAMEWETACRENGESSWPYGQAFRPQNCNLQSTAVTTAGAFPSCRSPKGVYDMSGNTAEWVQGGHIRGGSATDGSEGRCSQERVNPTLQPAYSDVGFRCCGDVPQN